MKILIIFSVLVLNSLYAQSPMGLTWGVQPSKLGNDLVSVGCHGLPGTTQGGSYTPSCNAYAGDTSCMELRPVLCINKTQPIARPSEIPTGDHYNEWSHGEVKITHPIQGNNLRSLESANAYCAEYFGRDWRMAEFHDGRGWGFWAKGKIKSDTRFWVHINDQRANCWNAIGAAPKDDEGLGDIKKQLNETPILTPVQPPKPEPGEPEIPSFLF